MQPALLLALSTTAWSMCAAGLMALVIGLLAAKKDLAKARGIDKIVALAPVCFALPLGVFGALHLADSQSLLALVPKYMPGRMFWVYFVGIALIAAALSIATGIQVRLSGLLVGITMFLFVAMLYFPGAIRTGARITWTIVFRETSFGSGGWVFAGTAMRDRRGKVLINIGRVLIGITAIFFGVEHFLHPLALPGVPLVRQMPAWVPAPEVIDYVTGAFLIAAGVCFLLDRMARQAATYLGAWIVLMVVVIYGPVLFGALADPKAGAQVEGINYFADTLLFGGTILSVARASRKRD